MTADIKHKETEAYSSEPAELSWLEAGGIVFGIYFCFLLYGISQEHVFASGKLDDTFKYGNFMICCVAFSNLIFAAVNLVVELGFTKAKEKVVSFPKDMVIGMAQVSLSSTVAMISTANALNYVNLPTQVLMKSAKSVPVMAGNYARGRRYPWYDNFSVLCVSCCLVLFNLAKKSRRETGSNSSYGISLLVLALVMDGITGPKQDTIIERHRPTSTELMFIQNAYSVVYSFCLWLAIDGLMNPISFMIRHPESMKWVVLYCICGMGGQFCIYKAIVNFGSLYVALLTTVRKFFTVLLSVIIFGHHLNRVQWLAVSGIFVALGMQSVFKNKAKRQALATQGKKLN